MISFIVLITKSEVSMGHCSTQNKEWCGLAFLWTLFWQKPTDITHLWITSNHIIRLNSYLWALEEPM